MALAYGGLAVLIAMCLYASVFEWYYDTLADVQAFVRAQAYDEVMLRALARLAWHDLLQHGRRSDRLVAGALGVERIIDASNTY